MFFSETSRVRIDHENGLVRLSLKSSDYSVDEFMIPFSEFDAFYDCATVKEDFVSDDIRIKWLSTNAILQLRESKSKRRIFKFSDSKINRILSEYAAEKIMYLDWLSKNKDLAHELTGEMLYREEEIISHDNEEVLRMMKMLDEKMDMVLNICLKLHESVNSLSGSIKDMEIKSASLHNKLIITEETVTKAKGDDLFLPKEESHFIPNDLNINFEGTVTSQSTSSEDGASDAAEALKKLRRSKK